MKLRGDVPSLRSARRFEIIRRCFKASRGLHGLRLVEFSVLSDHLHLVVEADDNVSLCFRRWLPPMTSWSSRRPAGCSESAGDGGGSSRRPGVEGS